LKAWFLLKSVRRAGGVKSGSLTWTFGDDSQASVSYEANIFKRYVRFTYSQDGDPVDYHVAITYTRCNYGGFRYWFICPLSSNGKPCNRRVGLLYMAGKYFGCRTCHDLTYRSQSESKTNSFSTLLRSYDLFDEIEALEARISRRSYRGRPTKKQRKLERLEATASSIHERAISLYCAEVLRDEKL